MPRNPATPGVSNSVTFQFPSGADASAAERGMLRSQLAAWALTDALGGRDQFWDDVDAVHSATDPAATARRLSLRYCQGKRRAVLATLLERGAIHPELRGAAQSWQRLALTGVGVCPVSADDGRKSRYVVDRSFMAPMLLAAHLVAARGAGGCLGFVGTHAAPEVPCSAAAVTGSLYCRRHDHAASDRLRWDAERERRVRRLFALAGPFILAGEMVALDDEAAA